MVMNLNRLLLKVRLAGLRDNQRKVLKNPLLLQETIGMLTEGGLDASNV